MWRTSEIADEAGRAPLSGERVMSFNYDPRDRDSTPMKAIQLLGFIDEQHRLQVVVPAEVPAGPVRLIVLLPDEDEGGTA